MDNSHTPSTPSTPSTFSTPPINPNPQPTPTPSPTALTPPPTAPIPQANTGKAIAILLGIFGGFLLLGFIIILVTYYLLFGKTGTSTTLSYLQEKYGSDIEFTQTGVGGGGIGISSHLTYYTTPDLGDKKFSVQYVKEDGKITSICDDYLTYKFSADIEQLYADIFKELGFQDFQIRVSGNNTCNHATPTDNFSDYLRDPEADVYAIIYQPYSAGITIDKQAIANHFATRLSELGFYDKTQAESTNADFARIVLVSDECTDSALYHCSIKYYLKDFQISYDGYWNIKEDV